ncbi:GNAT family N-acetyltransferase [Halorubellus salinus]|uniref:GNAT family N-acetyltransferase n=1 Tax=Halorubellus salinus TaxID=755309 RepID=UPI001D07D739|nr:GNAT family protein [Halorubellus salinus]
MPGATFLEGDRVELCTMEAEDAAFLTEAVNDPAVRQSLGVADPRSRAHHEEWIEEEVNGGDGIALLVVADDEPVGVVSTVWIADRNGHAILSAWIAADAHGEGYGSDATTTFIDYLFDEKRMHSVRAEAYETNEASNALLSSIGLEHVGTIPEGAFVDGEFVDSHIYSITADDWRAQRA